MLCAVVVAYIASAVLPIWGAVRLYRAAKSEAQQLADKNHGRTDVMTYGGMQNLMNGSIAAIVTKPKEVRNDGLLIASGVILGAAASITALFI